MGTFRKSLIAPVAVLMLGGASMVFAQAMCGTSCEDPQPTAAAADQKAPTTAPTTRESSAKAINTKCPVSGDDVDPDVTIVYQGKKIAFCCSSCVKDFNKNPAKYMAKLNK